MPFKSEKGVTIWEAPSKEDIENFHKILTDDPSAGESSGSVQAQLDSFAKQILHGARLLVNSNTSLLSSLSNVIKSGVKPVDLIVPVFGGLQVLKPCLDSILTRTYWPYKITLVDDCSPDDKTREWLRRWQEEHPEHEVLFNTKNRGFAATVNRGINSTENPYICLVNSDIMVTDNWMTKMILALEANPRNKICNPLTNNTALTNVPMQEGASYLDMNRAFERISPHRRPETMPTGFCFLFSRELVNKIGVFDEAYTNFGEESDYHMRCISYAGDGSYPRWRAILADDTYVYHERSSSFNLLGMDKHMGLRKGAAERFHTVWPQFRDWQKMFDINKTVGPLRQDIPLDLLSKPDSPYNVAFVVYSTDYCGGMRFIADIVNELNERGVNAKVVRIRRGEKSGKSVLAELRSAPVIFHGPKNFIDEFTPRVFDKGIVVAATNELSPLVGMLCERYSNLKPVLFAQSDDIAIAPDEKLKEEMAKAYSDVDHIITNSDWLDKQLNEKHKTLGFARPGVDTDLFYPRGREKGDDRPTVMFALIGGYPYKGSVRGVEAARVLWTLARRNRKEMRILAYGPTQVADATFITCYGQLSQSRLAHLLGTEVDIFCDPSQIQTYGLPALEALVSGVPIVSWDNKGVREYADESNSIIVHNDAQPEVIANKMYNLLFDEPRLKEMKEKSLLVNQTRSTGVRTFIDLMEKNLNLRAESKKIAVIAPHLRKHGGPTTIVKMANQLQSKGHDVTLYTVYPDINPEIADICKVPMRIDWKKIKGYDALITNSDNPHNDFFSTAKHVKKKIMLKLSHNARFKELEEGSLKLKWDAIVTSTEWLKDVCSNPSEGWSYPPQKAERVGWFHYGHEYFNCPPSERSYGSLKEGLTIGTLAHHHALKGTSDALQSIKAIKAKYPNTAHIITVGEWPEFVKGRPPWVQYLYCPNRYQLAESMRKMDIWVVASHTEGLGRMALEAMSSGCAIVITTRDAEFAENNENCLVVDKGDINGISLAIDRLINDPILRRKLSENGYKTACRYADPTEYTNRLDEVIGGLFDD